MELTKEPDLEAQKDGIRIVMNNIVTTLEYFIDTNKDLQYIFAFVPTSSSEAIVKYLYLVIDFFKSWKVHFLDPASTYTLTDRYNDKDHYYEQLAEMRYQYWKDDHNSMRDTIVSSVHLHFKEDIYALNKEKLEIYAYFDKDPDFNNCYDGWYPDTEAEETIQCDGGGVVDCIPFVMVNGGTPFGIGLFDTITLDGGPADDQAFYANIDGYDISDPNWKVITGNDFEPVGYNVFGGFPGKYWSNSAYTDIDDTLQISSDIRVSSAFINNGLVMEPDGLYFGNGVGDYVTGEEYREFLVVLDYIAGELIPAGGIYVRNIQLFSSYEFLSRGVEKTYYDILHSAVVITNPQELINQEYFDETMNTFPTWFNEVWPYQWETF